MVHSTRCFQRHKCWQTCGICGIETTQPQRIHHGWKELKHRKPYCIRVLRLLLTRVSIVMYCLVPFLYTHNPITDELVPPCSKVSVVFACKFTRFAFASVLVICGGDVRWGHAPLWYICLIGGVWCILLTSTGHLLHSKEFQIPWKTGKHWIHGLERPTIWNGTSWHADELINGAAWLHGITRSGNNLVPNCMPLGMRRCPPVVNFLSAGFQLTTDNNHCTIMLLAVIAKPWLEGLWNVILEGLSVYLYSAANTMQYGGSVAKVICPP